MHWQRCTKPWPKKPKKSDRDRQFAILLIHRSPCRGKGLAAVYFWWSHKDTERLARGTIFPNSDNQFRTAFSLEVGIGVQLSAPALPSTIFFRVKAFRVA